MVYDGIAARQVGLIAREVSIPSVAAMVSLQKERLLSVSNLGRAASTSSKDLNNQRQQVDRLLAEYRKAADPLVSSAPASVATPMKTLNYLLDQLPSMRSRIDSRETDTFSATDYYNRVLDAATNLFHAEAHLDNLTVSTSQAGDASIAVFHVADVLSRAASLASSAIGTQTFTPQDQLQFSLLVGFYHSELDTTLPLLPATDQASLRSFQSSASWKALTDAENAFIGHGAWSSRVPTGLPSTEQEWLTLVNPALRTLADVSMTTGEKASSMAVAQGTDKLVGVAIGSLVALLASIAAIIVAVKVSRTLVDRALVTRLERLKNESIKLGNRLPGIVKLLRDGASVDVKAELPELDYGEDEIGELAKAFNATHHTAVAAAVNEARARDGVHNVFLGIAHRNQGLVHRQLQILDVMEREEENPEQLERLFQLDHFATQSRRNAENLMILGGEQPGRRWHKPARLVDVVRAAVAETEQYARVQVERVPAVSIVGSTVADVIHMIAELVDNATSFSPKTSQVHVTSTRVARGVVIEVEDQGLGMSEEARDRANTMMAKPPEFDAMALRSDPRLGLFVVAQLAARLGAKLEFRVSTYGGTRVIVLLPSQMLAPDGQDGSETDSGSQLSRRVGHVQTFPAKDDNGVNYTATGSEVAEHLAARRRHLKLRGTAEGEDVELPSDPRRPIHRVPEQRPSAISSRQELPANEDVTVADNGSKERPQLPQRRPQQNIAPQLRNDNLVETTEPTDDRSADEIRRTMSAFQKGTQEGRQAGDSLE
jgi:signal transduction histidine kinase